MKKRISGWFALILIVASAGLLLSSCTSHVPSKKRVLSETEPWSNLMGFRFELQDLDALVRASDIIVKGHVEKVNPPAATALNQDSLLLDKSGAISINVTRSVCKVSEVFYGDGVTDQISIQQIGDEDSCETKLEAGKTYILFLEKVDGYYRPTDLENGVYAVTGGRSVSLGNNPKLCQYDGKRDSVLIKEIRERLDKVAAEGT